MTPFSTGRCRTVSAHDRRSATPQLRSAASITPSSPTIAKRARFAISGSLSAFTITSAPTPAGSPIVTASVGRESGLDMPPDSAREEVDDGDQRVVAAETARLEHDRHALGLA